jgi:hypothetical protein
MSRSGFHKFVAHPLSTLVGQFDVEAALRRHSVRQVTYKIAATRPN